MRIGTLLLVFLLYAHASRAEKLSDEEIRTILVEQSIATYDGPCPCPYNVMRNGRPCGGVSAYSKPGGEQPLCYTTDVSDEMVERYRKIHKSDDDA